MRIIVLRLLALSTLVTLLIFFWNSTLLKPFKLFVVFLHEISHAAATILTGGELASISIKWDESGATYAASGKGIFFIIAIAGYIGSIIWGSMMLRASLTGRWVRTVSLVVGLTVIFFGFFPEREISSLSERLLKYIISGVWGLTLIFTAFVFPRINHIILFFLGGLTSLYSLYDLDDFIHGDLMKTDAGILARYLLGDSRMAIALAWCIAIFISAIAIYIFFRQIKTAIAHQETEPTPEPVNLVEWQAQNPDVEITAEMLDWLKSQSGKKL